VFGWQHDTGTEHLGGDVSPWRLRYDADLRRWKLDWGVSFGNVYFGSLYALPWPGMVTFGALWFGDPTTWQNRLVWGDADALGGVGGEAWHDSTNSRVRWWSPGDFVINKGAKTRWPVAWRPKGRTGISEGTYGSQWQNVEQYRPGMSITPTTGNGY